MKICRLRSLLFLAKCNSQTFPSTAARTFSSTNHHLQNVGFIGLGNMGSRMVNNLIKAGFNLTVHDKNNDALKMFSQMGVPTKKTPYEVSEASDVVITMLPSSAHVIDVYTGPNGLLHGGKLVRSWLLIDSSTIDPQTSRNLSATISNYILKEKKGNLEMPVKLDAPVSGSIIAAEAGTLTFMVWFHFCFVVERFLEHQYGLQKSVISNWLSNDHLWSVKNINLVPVDSRGSEEAFLAAKPLFLSMGKSTIYCGGAGSGSAAKICNNLALAVSMLGISEALALGQSLGVSASTLTKIFNCSSARCWSSDAYNPVPGLMEGVPSSKDYNGGFASKLMAKDLNLAVESAKLAGCKYPLTSQAQKIYTELCNGGHDAKDFSCAFRHFYAGMDEPLDN